MRRLALALALAATPAAAQAPAPAIDMLPMIDGLIGSDPAPAPAAAPEPALAANTAPAPAAETVVPLRLADGTSALVRLADGGILRLSGERVVAQLELDLTGALGDTLRLAYHNSINVLPSASSLRVSVNGAEPAVLPTDAFDDFATVDIPAPSLMPGRNTVTVEAIQHHRIFCGVDASFGVWTEIDLSRSGLVVADASGRPDARALLAQAGAGSGPVKIHVAPEADAAVATALAAQVRAILPGRQVELASPWDPAPDPKIARITLRRGASAGIATGVGADGAPLLVVTHAPATGDPVAALPAIDDPADAAETYRVDPPPVAALVPGEPTQLADLGFTPRIQAAAYFDDAVELTLPPDWLALASQKAHLLLDYSFAPGLPTGARLLVNVNGTTVRELPLDRDGGTALPTLDVGFLASLLGPGKNQVRFETIVGAAEPQLPCPALPEQMVSISPASRLVVPTTPSMYFDGMERGLPDVVAADVVVGAGFSPGERRAIAEAFPGTAAAPATLQVVRADAFAAEVAGDLPLTAMDVISTLEREPTPVAAAAPAPAPAPSGPFAALRTLPQRAWDYVTKLAVPGDGPLAGWLGGHTAEAMLLQPDTDRPDRLVLVIGPNASPGEVARRVAADRLAHDGPQGRVALLGEDGRWDSWRPPYAPPRLAGAITVMNLRDILGNFASWSPLAFTAILFVLTVASGMVAVVFIRATRRAGRK